MIRMFQERGSLEDRPRSEKSQKYVSVVNDMDLDGDTTQSSTHGESRAYAIPCTYMRSLYRIIITYMRHPPYMAIS